MAPLRRDSTRLNGPQRVPSPCPSDSSESSVVTLSPRVRELLPPTVVALYENNYGLALIAFAQFFFACMSLSVKYLMETTDMSTLTLIFVRMGITGTCCWATLLIQREPYPFLGPPGVRALLAWRGFCGFSGLLCAYQALRGLSVSDTVTIQFITPSVTALLAYLIMHEKFSLKEAASGCISLIGVVLITRPPFIFGHGWQSSPLPVEPDAYARVRPSPVPVEDDDATRMIAALWALGGVLFSASAYLSIRYIGKRASALHSISYFSMACTITSGIAMLFAKDLAWPKDRKGFALIILIGIFGFCAQTLLTLGLQREKAGRAGLAMYLQIFFAVTLELVFFHLVPSFLSFCGTVIILASAAWVAMDTLKAKPPVTPADPESMPISRTPSPSPLPGKSVRGEFYSYATTEEDRPGMPPRSSTMSSSTTLNVPLTKSAE